MWSDPDDIENWAVSPRGAGWLFGGNVTQEVSTQFTWPLVYDAYCFVSVQPRQLVVIDRSGTSIGPGGL